jgi:single-strand DNA-binding protein
MLRVTGSGRLTRDPEPRELPDGTPVCEIRIAVDRMGRGDRTGYLDFCEYGKGGVAAASVLGRGWKVLVDGRLEFDEWEREDGGKRSSYRGVGRIEFLAPPRTPAASEPHDASSS